MSVVDLSDSNLVIPLNRETYPHCWSRVRIEMVIDSLGKSEINERNNIVSSYAILDCGC